MEYTESLLIADNRRLTQKIAELDAQLLSLKSKEMVPYDSEFLTYSGGHGVDHKNDEEETLESVTFCLNATEELCGISVIDYTSTVLLPSEELPPGKWREVSMNVVVLDTLKAVITVIEGEQNGDHRILSLECVAGDTPLTRNELSSLITECCNSTPPQCEKLLTSLVEYVTKYAQRHKVIKTFKENHQDNVRVHTSEDKVIVQWCGRLFGISWSVQWCSKTESMQDIIFVEIGHHANPAFVRECESSLRRFTEFTTSPESRLQCLEDIARRSLMYN